MAKTPNYDINYNDKRLTSIQNEGKTAVKDSNKTYDGMIKGNDKFIDDQINAVQNYEKTQTDLQNQKTDFAIEKIEQQKEQTRQDYLKEQSGAYVDWQKQSGQYGVNAEKQAAAGLGGTGFSESSQVSMYNTYQNRVATAREAYGRAVLNYDNAIKDAQLQNSAALAEIAFNSLQKQLELSLQGFQYKNQLLLDKAATQREINNTYYGRYRDEISQINTENAMAENVRQYNERMAEEKRQHNESLTHQQNQLQLDQDKFDWQKEQADKPVSDTPVVDKDKDKDKNKKTTAKPSYSNAAYLKKLKADEKKTNNTMAASDYLNKLITSGADKDKVANEIAIALREGAITKKEAQKLRNRFTPRGIQY